MTNQSTALPLIVESSRGPSVAGRRTTVYVILEHLKGGLDKEFIKEHLSLSDEQLDAALDYIEQHRDEVEREYMEIVRLSEENRAYYETLYLKRSRFAGLSVEERAEKMRQDLVK
jgi:uncharacterized protein (DUF433 family)